MTNLKCNEIEGAMYAYPSVKFSKKFLDLAKSMGLPPDTLYCLKVLENTGIVILPGSGFG